MSAKEINTLTIVILTNYYITPAITTARQLISLLVQICIFIENSAFYF